MDIAKNKKRIEAHRKRMTQNNSEVDNRPKSPRQQKQADLFDDGRVRPEINFAKYADRIFLAPQSRKLRESRTITWYPTLFDQNTDDPAELIIEPVQGGKTGTTTTYKVWLGLIRLWEIQGKNPNGKVVFSARELAKILKLQWNGRAAKQIREALDTLGGVRYTWHWSFTDEAGEPLKVVRRMHMLSSEDYMENRFREDNEKFERLHAITFHDLIRENLIAGRTKPVELETFISIPNGTASALYMRLDIILSKHTHYERTATNLLADLEIEGARYQARRIRKAKIQDFIDILNGKDLSTGNLQLSLRETADRSDWKLVARKIPRKEIQRLPARKPRNSKELRDHLTSLILETVGQESRRRLWELLAATYSEQIIRQALSEYKVDAPQDVRNHGRFFMAIVHRLVHLHGQRWIKDCDETCKWRPGNQLTH